MLMSSPGPPLDACGPVAATGSLSIRRASATELKSAAKGGLRSASAGEQCGRICRSEGKRTRLGASDRAAANGSSLSRPLSDKLTEFDVTFTVLRPGLLHVTIYDMDNHDKNDNVYAGIYLGDVVFKR